jgi:hypothetical protein
MSIQKCGRMLQDAVRFVILSETERSEEFLRSKPMKFRVVKKVLVKRLFSSSSHAKGGSASGTTSE